MDGVRRWWRGLGARLLASHLVVAFVGIATLLIAAEALAPRLLEQHMAGMGGGGMGFGAMMGAGHMLLDDSVIATLRQAQFLAGLTGVGAALIVSFVVAERIGRPIRRIAAASRALAAGEPRPRVGNAGDDEIGELAREFDTMADALEGTERRRLALIGDVAHEMRTPLTTIEGYLEGVIDGVVAPDAETIARMHGEARRLRRLVDDLGQLSRAEAGQIALDIAPRKPGPLVAAALARLGDAIADSGLSVTTDAPDDVPEVRADGDRVVQVLTNLLTNALRYTPPPGTIAVSVRPDGANVLFSVADSGIGLAPEDTSRVFERFYRVDRARTRARGGSGVGLTIAQALVEAMGGRMSAESPGIGRGATFRFTLPRA
ncbi:MAG: HAMP domain-containing protein [Chloroflexota bacterium]|nr:MAG: HAMP domain-containing protein [Chloroflexota bacterium]